MPASQPWWDTSQQHSGLPRYHLSALLPPSLRAPPSLSRPHLLFLRPEPSNSLPGGALCTRSLPFSPMSSPPSPPEISFQPTPCSTGVSILSSPLLRLQDSSSVRIHFTFSHLQKQVLPPRVPLVMGFSPLLLSLLFCHPSLFLLPCFSLCLGSCHHHIPEPSTRATYSLHLPFLHPHPPAFSAVVATVKHALGLETLFLWMLCPDSPRYPSSAPSLSPPWSQ